ncbi:MAG: AlpA family phage regulatory protein [Betaproteobacteria bacterium]|nr:AlpA family phage regulatory protein [Betaproteobacteria bacterium]
MSTSASQRKPRNTPKSPRPSPDAYIWRMPQVMNETGLNELQIYRAMRAVDCPFPRQVQLTPRSVGWIADEVRAWRAARIAQREIAAAQRSEQMRTLRMRTPARASKRKVTTTALSR